MTGIKQLIREEPASINFGLDAFDEKTRTIQLAEFSVSNVCRYSLNWTRNDPNFATNALDALGQVIQMLPQEARCVLGWKHDDIGYQKVKHRHLMASLRKAGCELAHEPGIGVATVRTSTHSLHEAFALAASKGIGCFVAVGEWATPDTLVREPFRATVESFCWNHRMAPSAEFLSAVGVRAGALAYRVSGDDRESCLIIVTARPLGDWLARNFGLGEYASQKV